MAPSVCIPHSAFYNPQFLRGHSSVGRAPALQAGSQGFESPCLQSQKLPGLSPASFDGGGCFPGWRNMEPADGNGLAAGMSCDQLVSCENGPAPVGSFSLAECKNL